MLDIQPETTEENLSRRINVYKARIVSEEENIVHYKKVIERLENHREFIRNGSEIPKPLSR